MDRLIDIDVDVQKSPEPGKEFDLETVAPTSPEVIERALVMCPLLTGLRENLNLSASDRYNLFMDALDEETRYGIATVGTKLALNKQNTQPPFEIREEHVYLALEKRRLEKAKEDEEIANKVHEKAEAEQRVRDLFRPIKGQISLIPIN